MKIRPCWTQFLLVVLVIAFGAADPETADTKSALGGRSVKSFISSGKSALDTLLLFCQQEGIPLGVEYVDEALLRTPVKVKVSGSTVTEVLDKILGPLEGYRWIIEDGVIVVTHVSLEPPDNRNILRLKIPHFKTSESTLAEASSILRMTIDREVHPDVRGWVGNYPPGNTLIKIGPFNLKNLSVRTILNHLIAEHGSAGWIVNVPPGNLGELTSWGLWRMIEYEELPRRYSAELEQVLKEFRKRETKSPVPDG